MIEIIKSFNENEVYGKKVKVSIPVYSLKDELIPRIEKIEDEYLKDTLLSLIDNGTIIEHSAKKTLAAEKATETRTKKAKEKIDNGINILRLENKKITHYSISKVAGVSFNTVKKYLSNNDLISFNEIE